MNNLTFIHIRLEQGKVVVVVTNYEHNRVKVLASAQLAQWVTIPRKVAR